MHLAKLGSEAYGTRHARVRPSVMQCVLAVRETVVIKPSRLNIVAQGLSISLPVPSLSPYTHLSLKKREVALQHTPSGKSDDVALHYTCPTHEVVHWASP